MPYILITHDVPVSWLDFFSPSYGGYGFIASVSELKKHPMWVADQAEGEAIAILHRNKAAFYCAPTDLWELLLDPLEGKALSEIIASRSYEREIEVDIHGL